ncbi:MAG: aminoglycoside phosphotransferase family protein [Microthrixaceae bacterium]
MTTGLRVPDRLANTVAAAFGDVGRDWLERLPTLVADVASAWELEVGAPFEPGGNVGWVAPVRRADGSHAALKVECPGHANPWAAKGLRHWNGRGAVRLLDSDDARQTTLLELCVPGTDGDELDVGTASEAVAAMLSELHAVEPPGGHEFEFTTVLEHICETMWDCFDRFDAPMDRGVVAHADDLYTSLSTSSTDTVLLHGDLGPSNVVLSERGWLAIDPYPEVGDRSLDVGHSLSRCDLRDARGLVAMFAERLDLDARRIAGWAFANCVEVALESKSVGSTEGMRMYLDRAHQLSSQHLL